MNLSKFTIGTYIRKILIDNVQLSNIVGSSIYPLIAPEGTEGSFVIYQRDEYSRDYSKDGIFRESCVIYITAVSDSYDLAQQVAIIISDLLEGDGTDYIIRLTDSTEDFTEGKYIQVLKFNIV